MSSQRNSTKGPLSNFLITHGIARTEQQAQAILIGVIVCGLLLVLFMNRPGSHITAPVDTEEDILFEEMIAEEGLEE